MLNLSPQYKSGLALIHAPRYLTRTRFIGVTLFILAMSTGTCSLFLGLAGTAHGEEQPSSLDLPPYKVEQEPLSSAGSVLYGPVFGITGFPGGTRLGHDYNFSLNGPLLLSVQTDLLFSGDAVGLQLVPGVKYRLEGLMPYGMIPHVKAGLATGLYFGSAKETPVTVTARFGPGIRYFFTRRLGVGVDWDIMMGSASGDDRRFAFATGLALAFEYIIP